MTLSKATRWITFWCSRQESDFLYHRPGGARHVGEEREIGIGCGALRTRPGGFHRFPTIKIKFDDGIPLRMGAAGVSERVVLLVPLQSGKFSRQGCVDFFEMLAELRGIQIRPATENHHELQHSRYAASISPASSSARRGSSEITMCS